MTISTALRRDPYTGDGTLATYQYDFQIFDKNDLYVVKQDTSGNVSVLTVDLDYTVAGVGAVGGGSITLTAGVLLAGYKLLIRDNPAIKQTSDLRNRGGFFPEEHETAFDYAVRLIRSLWDGLTRSIKFPDTDGVGLTTTLPPAAIRANKFLAFDGAGNVIASSGGISSAIPVSAFIQTVVDDADTRTVFNTFGVAAAQALGAMGQPLNFSLAASVGANALTMAVKGSDGNNPSATNPVWVPFRSSNAALGSIVWRSIAGALSLAVSSGSTLGHNSGLKQYIYHYLIDNGGVVEYAVSSKFFGWHGIVSTTAEGGAGAADSGTVMYSATARASVPFLCVAITEDTQAAAGTWATAPSAVRLAPFEHPLISFSAHKNAVNQAGVANATDTKVTLGTTIYNNGALYDTANSRITPPPGKISLAASLEYTASADPSAAIIYIYKNNAPFKRVRDIDGSVSAIGVNIAVDDECNGADFYEVWTQQTTGANQTVDGSTVATWFTGSWSPQRS